MSNSEKLSNLTDAKESIEDKKDHPEKDIKKSNEEMNSKKEKSDMQSEGGHN
ncbi:MAG: hypothetical protein ACK4NR_10905 [Micavibrio sp.]